MGITRRQFFPLALAGPAAIACGDVTPATKTKKQLPLPEPKSMLKSYVILNDVRYETTGGGNKTPIHRGMSDFLEHPLVMVCRASPFATHSTQRGVSLPHRLFCLADYVFVFDRVKNKQNNKNAFIIDRVGCGWSLQMVKVRTDVNATPKGILHLGEIARHELFAFTGQPFLRACTSISPRSHDRLKLEIDPEIFSNALDKP